jgi:hypothetical protein
MKAGEQSETFLLPNYGTSRKSKAKKRSAEVWFFLGRQAFDPKPIDNFKVAPIVRQKCEVVLESRRSNQKIEIANELAMRTEAAAQTAETFASLHIQAKHGKARYKFLEPCLAPFGISGVVDPLPELSERDYADRQSLVPKLTKPLGDSIVTTEVFNRPVRVYQKREWTHSRGAGRV